MRCINCFKEIGSDTICPLCGYEISEYHCPEACLAPGIIIGGRYEIGRVIGEGGFGITYAAYDKTLNGKCAVKEYFPRGLSSRMGRTYIKTFSDTAADYSNGLRHFKQEAAELAKFDGIRNIVNVKNYISENNTGYIIMNFVEGISLNEYLESNGGRLTPERAFSLIEPIISVLERIEKEGIIHRDISPDNLILRATGELVLIDFGSARAYNTDKSMTVILKHGYAPPEQYSSVGTQGPWTDIYALCATLYKMITGTVPPDAMERIGGKDKLIPISKLGVKISKQREKAIMKGLSVNAGDRFLSASELYDALYRGEHNAINIGRLIPITASAAAVFIMAGIFFGTPKDAEETAAVETLASSVQTEETEIQTTVSEKDIYADIARGELDNGSWYISYDGVLNINAEGRLETDNKIWIKYRNNIKEAVLSDSITEIGDGVFKRLSSLKTVTFPEKLSHIGAEAFSQTALTEASIPDSVEYIGEKAFWDTDVKKIELPSRELYIGANSFGSCNKLESVFFPAGYVLHSDLDEQFAWGKSLSDIYLSDGITDDTAESIIRSLKKKPSSYYNVHFPDNTEISDELISEIPTYITAVGKSSCPAVMRLADSLYSVEFTDDLVPDIYVNRNTLYINSNKYTKFVPMEFYPKDSDFSTNITLVQLRDAIEFYRDRIDEYLMAVFPDKFLEWKSISKSEDAVVSRICEPTYINGHLQPRESDAYFFSNYYKDLPEEEDSDGRLVYIYFSEEPKNAANIKKGVLSDNVTKIEATALSNYSEMYSIFVPRTVTEISDHALGWSYYIYTTPGERGYIEEYAEQFHHELIYVESAEEYIKLNT